MELCEDYSGHFIGQGMNGVGHVRHYLAGLLGTQRRKNMETIGNDVAGGDYQGIEQFISSSPWSHRSLMDQVAGDANGLLGDDVESGFYIDETSFLKKGKASVGVQRQWSGRAGKVENCQVGVFAALGRNEQVALTDFRLFLPESWAQDEVRCAKAKVPEHERGHRAKWELALEMVKHARKLGLSYGWVGVDSLYGSNAAFVNALEDLGERFMGDVAKTTKVWTSKPQLEQPRPAGQGVGRPRKLARQSPDDRALYISVGDLTHGNFDSKCRRVCYRQGQKGQLWTRLWVRRVWCWEQGWPEPRKRLLVVRHDADEGFKYSLTNLPEGLPWERYAWVQAQRFWVEHAFRECKSQLGMAQYQVRLWRGWHHHMGLVCLAQLFTVKAREQLRSTAPLLTPRDITELLDHYLPRKNRSEAEVIAQIKHRHQLRQQDLERRKHKQTGLPSYLSN